MADTDQEIINVADRLEREKLEESKRRFDSIMGVVRTTAITLLVVGALGGGTSAILLHCNSSAAESKARATERARVFQTCLHAGLGQACTCLWDPTSCQQEASATCREKLSEQEYRCLLNAATCSEPQYEKCLLVLPLEDCRCLNNIQLCGAEHAEKD